jgi:predicted nucleotidyltransferase
LLKAYEGRLLALVFFGSRARGDAHATSDYDVWAVIEGLDDDVVTRDQRLRQLLFDAGVFGVNVVVQTPKEVDANLRPLHLDIGIDGRILYDRGGWAEDRLKRIRTKIRQHGLRRYRHQGNWVWDWTRQPKSARWVLEW